MSLTCKHGFKECDGCSSCFDDSETEFHCPVCEHELEPDEKVFRQDGYVIGCEHCVKYRKAEDEPTCRM